MIVWLYSGYWVTTARGFSFGSSDAVRDSGRRTWYAHWRAERRPAEGIDPGPRQALHRLSARMAGTAGHSERRSVRRPSRRDDRVGRRRRGKVRIVGRLFG